MEFELGVNRRNVPSADLLNDLKSVAGRLGKTTVTIQEYDRLGVYSSSGLRARFGSWGEVLSQGGLTVEHHNGGVTDLSHTAEHGTVTFRGLPAPIICDYLSREASRTHYAPETEFHIGKIEMTAL